MEIKKKNLSIKNKIILIISICFVAFSISIYFFSANFLLKRFISLESDQVFRNLDRVEFFLENSGDSQSIKIKDWAFWDDTYKFINDNNKEYIKSNLTDETLLSLKINAIVFINNKNEIIYSKFLDLDSKNNIPSDNFISYLNTNLNYIKNLKQKGKSFNIIKIPEGNMMISTEDILKSDSTGPSRGTILFGTFINDSMIKDISEFTRFPVSTYSYDTTKSNTDNGMFLAKSNLSQSNKYFSYIVSDKFVDGYSLIYDIYDKPINFVKVEIPRDIYNQGRNATYLLLMIETIFIFLLGIILIFLIKKFIINRLIKLENKLIEVGNSGNFEDAIIEDIYSDEIGSISSVINKMFSKIKESKNKEMELIKSENLVNENIKIRMEQIDKLNKLMIGRELKMIELKKENEKLKEEKNVKIIN